MPTLEGVNTKKYWIKLKETIVFSKGRRRMHCTEEDKPRKGQAGLTLRTVSLHYDQCIWKNKVLPLVPPLLKLSLRTSAHLAPLRRSHSSNVWPSVVSPSPTCSGWHPAEPSPSPCCALPCPAPQSPLLGQDSLQSQEVLPVFSFPLSRPRNLSETASLPQKKRKRSNLKL